MIEKNFSQIKYKFNKYKNPLKKNKFTQKIKFKNEPRSH